MACTDLPQQSMKVITIMTRSAVDQSSAWQILNALRLSSGPMTKKDLTDSTGCSTVQVNEAAAALVQSGLVIEHGFGPSSGGRPPVLLGMNPGAGYLVGIDVGGANTRAVVSDILGKVLFSYRQTTEVLLAGNSGLLEALRQLVESVLAKAGMPYQRLLGVGVALSGIVEHQRGVCVFCPNIPCSRELPVVDYLSKAFNVPVCIDDSVRGAVVAEHRFGIAQRLPDFMLVAIGIGLGAGYMMNGHLHRGVHDLGGELGHVTVRHDGPRCACGNTGCLEIYASAPGILRRARESLERGMLSSLEDGSKSNPLTIEKIARAAEAGDKMAFYVIDRTGEYMGTAIAATLNLLGLEEVILTGGVARTAGPVLLDATLRTVRKSVMPVLAPRVRVRLSSLDDLNVARGMIGMIGDTLFDPSAWKGSNPLLSMAARKPLHHAPPAIDSDGMPQ
jgi:N-acetylglucosamine repressor